MTFLAARSRAYLSVSASNATGNNSGFAGSGNVQTSSPPNPVIEGGSGDYSYSWAWISNSSGSTPNINNAAVANPLWSHPSVSGNWTSSWRLTVTDNITGLTAEVVISVILVWTDLS